MRENHRVFDSAGAVDPGVPIWRYFDFPKFVSLLKERALYFCRADLLGDPLEGSFTKAKIIEREQYLQDPPKGATRKTLEDIYAHNARLRKDAPKCMYVNCWHMGEHESMAMWKGYGDGPYGIAVRSTFGTFNELLPERFGGTGHDEPIFLAKVRYVDHGSETERIEHESNVFAPFICKSVAYRHENELRAILSDLPGWMKSPECRGFFVPVDIARLVLQLAVSPLAPLWFEDVVRTTCGKYGLDLQVTPSVVSVPPIY